MNGYIKKKNFKHFILFFLYIFKILNNIILYYAIIYIRQFKFVKNIYYIIHIYIYYWHQYTFCGKKVTADIIDDLAYSNPS